MFDDQHLFSGKFIFTSRQVELAKFYNRRTVVKITGFGLIRELSTEISRLDSLKKDIISGIDSVDKIYKFKFMFKA